jgi:hypothetical protein
MHTTEDHECRKGGSPRWRRTTLKDLSRRLWRIGIGIEVLIGLVLGRHGDGGRAGEHDGTERNEWGLGREEVYACSLGGRRLL